jgi:uncharacterized protein (TIGR02996 family)
MTEDDFLRAIIDDPANAPATWLVLADWLEDQGDSRAELVRLQHDPAVRARLSPQARDNRIRELIEARLLPVVPTLINSIGMRFAMVPPGRFGSEEIKQTFCLGTHAVTQEQYYRVMGTNPSWFSILGGGGDRLAGPDTRRHPVDSVSWSDAARFCGRLSELPDERQAGWTYRLPTSAELSYAGESVTAHFPVLRLAGGNRPLQPLAVGSSSLNAFGLYDLECLWEWTQDSAHDSNVDPAYGWWDV